MPAPSPLTGGFVPGGDLASELIDMLEANGPGNLITLPYAAAVTFTDPSAGSNQTITLTGNVTFTFPAPRAGAEFTGIVKQDATGSRTATWAATSGSVIFASGSKTLTTTANAVDSFQAWSDGVNWYVQLYKGFA